MGKVKTGDCTNAQTTSPTGTSGLLRLHNVMTLSMLSPPRTRWFDRGTGERCTKSEESCGYRLDRRWPERKIELRLHIWTGSKVRLAYASLGRTRWAEPERFEWCS